MTFGRVSACADTGCVLHIGVRLLLFFCLAVPFSVLALSGCGRGRTPSSAGNAGARSLFQDRAAEAGLAFRWGHNGKSPLNILETAGGGAGWIDYDRDGRPDIVLVGR